MARKLYVRAVVGVVLRVLGVLFLPLFAFGGVSIAASSLGYSETVCGIGLFILFGFGLLLTFFRLHDLRISREAARVKAKVKRTR